MTAKIITCIIFLYIYIEIIFGITDNPAKWEIIAIVVSETLGAIFDKHFAMGKKWRDIFLEIALRAIRKTHYDYGVWALGQENLTVQNFKNLNQSQGINFAQEEAVRDSILQEIIYSGLWKEHKINNVPTSYWIDREFPLHLNREKAINSDVDQKFFKAIEYMNPQNYVNDKKDFKIDMLFKRIQPLNVGEGTADGDLTFPVLIEAKRFELVNVDVRTGTYKINKPQISEIDKDISKLKLIKRYFRNEALKIKDETFNEFYAYIFLWGITHKEFSNKRKLKPCIGFQPNNPVKFNLKYDVIHKLANRDFLLSDDFAIKYLPIEWEFHEELRIKEFLWLSLIEIK